MLRFTQYDFQCSIISSLLTVPLSDRGKRLAADSPAGSPSVFIRTRVSRRPQMTAGDIPAISDPSRAIWSPPAPHHLNRTNTPAGI